MTSHEHHGLLGGTLEFGEEIRKRIPDFDKQVYGFLEYWKYWKEKGTRIDWLPELLTHNSLVQEIINGVRKYQPG